MKIKESKKLKIGDIIEIPIRRWCDGGEQGIFIKSICKVVDISSHHITVLTPYGAKTSISNWDLVKQGIYKSSEVVGNQIGK